MPRQNIITGIDLGSETVRAAVGRVGPEGDLHIIGVSEAPSEGVSKGVINSIEDAISSISSCVEKAERMVGIPIEHANISISGIHIISQESKGVVGVSRADGEIKEEDVTRVLEAAQTVATPPNYGILHVLPRSFSVDNQPGIKDPVGMTGIRLEVDAQIILGLSNQIKNLTKCFYRVGIGIDELVFTILATAEAVLNKHQKELGVAVVNLGNTTTSMACFEEGDILSAKILPIGSRHITSDIAIGLRIPMRLAEKIKVRYGTADPQKVSPDSQINFKDLDEAEEGSARRLEVAEIIQARCEEIFRMADRELANIDRSGKLPAGIVLTGGGIRLDGIVESAKQTFKLPVSIGASEGFISSIDKAYDVAFSTAVGLVLWSHRFGRLRSTVSRRELGGKIKKWFKSLLP